jgi:hypothetical protein
VGLREEEGSSCGRGGCGEWETWAISGGGPVASAAGGGGARGFG